MSTRPTLPISCFIITLNEEDRIGRTIDAVLPLVSELIVVDSGSADRTCDIAKAKGAMVVHHDWEGYGKQKRFGESQCTHPWLLNLDADEVVTHELRAEIQNLFAEGEPPHKAYLLDIVEVLPGQKAPNRFSHVTRAVRLYRKDAGHYSESPVHDRVELYTGIETGILTGICHHFCSRGIGHTIDKINRYSSMQADDMETKGRSVRVVMLMLPFIFPLAFLKSYLLRAQIMQGMPGFINAVVYAFGRFLKFAKYVERKIGS